jgi:hypothetical protein
VGALSRRTTLIVLGLASGTVVAAEVLLTRLLSVVTWYALGFLVLSIAMLGLTAGALSATAAKRAGAPLRPWVAGRLLHLSIGLLAATMVVLNVPLTFTLDAASFGAVLLVIVASTVPMIAGGAVVARLMAEAEVPVATLYAFDLVAAAAGSLAPLAMLGPLSAPSALVALAGVAALASRLLAPGESPGRQRLVLVACAALLAISQFSSRGLVVRYPKGTPRGEDALLFEEWNALSYVTLSGFSPQDFPLWSPGSKALKGKLPVASAFIDGEAGTMVYAYSSLDRLKPLESDATAIAHSLRPDGTSCVIGIGGGRDLLTALLHEHDRVVGFEINPSMVRMLRTVEAYSPVVNDPRVRIVVGDGRTELARSGVRCRVLQASLVDTWAATSAGAFAHTESTLYTRDAWALFLRRVEPDGVLTFSRWYDPEHLSETSRLLSLAVASLLDRGAAHPRDHIALVAAAKVATIVVSPSPLSAAVLTRLHESVEKWGFKLVAAPDAPPSDPVLEGLLQAQSIDALARVGEPHGLDTSPPTDDRPFFFQLLAPRAWLHPVEVTRHLGAREGALSGNVASTFELLLTLLGVLAVGGFLLGPTLVRAAKAPSPPLPGPRAAVYFGALGAGFMLAEIALVQRMHVVLGHPTYALVVVLAALLVATGAGSAISSRVLRERAHVGNAALAAAMLLAAIPFAVVRPLARASTDTGFAARVAWCGATAALVGLLLGMLFPAALRYCDRERGAPVALAVNGATGVVGGVLAVMTSVWLGIPATFVLAGALYAIAGLCGPARWRSVSERTSG